MKSVKLKPSNNLDISSDVLSVDNYQRIFAEPIVVFEITENGLSVETLDHFANILGLDKRVYISGIVNENYDVMNEIMLRDKTCFLNKTGQNLDGGSMLTEEEETITKIAMDDENDIFVSFKIPNDYVFMLCELSEAFLNSGFTKNNNTDIEIIIKPEKFGLPVDKNNQEYKFLNLRIFDIAIDLDWYTVRFPTFIKKEVNSTGHYEKKNDFNPRFLEKNFNKQIPCSLFVSLNNSVYFPL